MMYLFNLNMNTVDHKYSLLEQYDLIKCEINHNMVDFATAKLQTAKPIKYKSRQYFALADDDQIIFCGVIIESKNHNEYLLEAIPYDFEKQKANIFSQHRDGKLLNKGLPMKDNLIIWNANNLRGVDMFEKSRRVKNMTLDTVYEYSVVNHDDLAFKANVNVKWSNYFVQDIDVGSNLFKDDGLETFTPKALMNVWPKKNSQYKDCQVLQSNILVEESRWEKIDGRYVQKSKLKGELLLQRVCQIEYNELWSISVNKKENSAEEIVDLYVDLSSYFTTYPAWKMDVSYQKGSKALFNKALFNKENAYELKICNTDHVSTSNPSEYWDVLDGEYYISSDQLLFKSHMGKDLFGDLSRYLYAHLIVKKPQKTVSFKAPWKLWKSINISDIVNCVLDELEFKTIILKYRKVYSNKESFIEITCNFYATGNAETSNPAYETSTVKSHDQAPLKLIEEPSISTQPTSSNEFGFEVNAENTADVQRISGSQIASEFLPTYVSLFLSPNVLFDSNVIEMKCCLGDII